jgi:hypothetical protein
MRLITSPLSLLFSVFFPKGEATAHVIVVATFLLFFFFAILYNLHDVYQKRSKDDKDWIRFEYLPSEFNRYCVQMLETRVGNYSAPWWYSAHLGTILAFGRDKECKYDDELLISEDGISFKISWFPKKPDVNWLKEQLLLERVRHNLSTDNSHCGSFGKVILYFPGLGLSAQSVSF